MVSSYKTGVRIISGRWKGRKIPVPDISGLRPTSDRVRETLFNWLQSHIGGARCVDLFAGSGVLSFEALSRGASAVVAIDADRQSIRAMRQAQTSLGARGLTLVHDDVERVLATEPELPFDIAFLDPPFNYTRYQQTLELLYRNNWLLPRALLYVEFAKANEFEYPRGWRRYKSGQAGNVAYQLLQTGFL